MTDHGLKILAFCDQNPECICMNMESLYNHLRILKFCYKSHAFESLAFRDEAIV